MSEFHRTTSTITAYKQRHGSWPVQLRLGSESIAFIVDQKGEPGIRALAEKMDLRVVPGRSISVGGRSVIDYEQALQLKMDPAQDTNAEVYRWLGIERR